MCIAKQIIHPPRRAVNGKLANARADISKRPGKEARVTRENEATSIQLPSTDSRESPQHKGPRDSYPAIKSPTLRQRLDRCVHVDTHTHTHVGLLRKMFRGRGRDKFDR